MLHTSNRKKISSFGLNVPASIKKRNLSRWCGCTEEDTHMRPGHHWFCEFGDAGNGKSCERHFNHDHRKCEDYRGTHFYNKDSALVIK
jgi:hypothetical protein